MKEEKSKPVGVRMFCGLLDELEDNLVLELDLLDAL